MLFRSIVIPVKNSSKKDGEYSIKPKSASTPQRPAALTFSESAAQLDPKYGSLMRPGAIIRNRDAVGNFDGSYGKVEGDRLMNFNGSGVWDGSYIKIIGLKIVKYDEYGNPSADYHKFEGDRMVECDAAGNPTGAYSVMQKGENGVKLVHYDASGGIIGELCAG